jgi:leader peptidase (prepilin peptidase)/N-methyltransferase
MAHVATEIFFGARSRLSLVPVVLAALAGVASTALHARELGWQNVPTACLFALLSAVTLFDARFMIVTDAQCIALGAMGLVDFLITDPSSVILRLAASIASFAGMKLLSDVHLAFRGVRGLGLGDAKLLAAGAMWIGFEGVPTAILWAVVSGLLSTMILARQGERISRHTAIPFGPHLSAGIWLVWTLGPLVISG